MLANSNKVLYVVDTSVFIEYLEEESPLAKKAELLLNKAVNGEVELHTTSLVASELLYVASRLYRSVGIPEPNQKAYEYLIWLINYVGVKVVDIDYNLAVRMGELKKKLKLSLTDCSVIAYADMLGAIPLFKRVEREMAPILNELKREVKIAFLEELDL